MKAIESPVGAAAFDHYGHLSLPQTQALSRLGFRVALLYAGVVDANDLQFCFAAGLSVGFIMQGLAASTQPTNALGVTVAQNAIVSLTALGVPPGPHLVQDLEGGTHYPADWIAFSDAASLASESAGWKPAVYVGDSLGLTSAQLFSLRAQLYWKSMSRVVDSSGQIAEPQCGWAMVQMFPGNLVVGGTQIDVDIIGRDYQQRTLWVVEG